MWNLTKGMQTSGELMERFMLKLQMHEGFRVEQSGLKEMACWKKLLGIWVSASMRVGLARIVEQNWIVFKLCNCRCSGERRALASDFPKGDHVLNRKQNWYAQWRFSWWSGSNYGRGRGHQLIVMYFSTFMRGSRYKRSPKIQLREMQEGVVFRNL